MPAIRTKRKYRKRAKKVIEETKESPKESTDLKTELETELKTNFDEVTETQTEDEQEVEQTLQAMAISLVSQAVEGTAAETGDGLTQTDASYEQQVVSQQYQCLESGDGNDYSLMAVLQSDGNNEYSFIGVIPSDGQKRPYCPSTESRELHNHKERLRRSRMKCSCDALRALVPGLSDKTDKATVLEHTVAFLFHLSKCAGVKCDDYLPTYPPPMSAKLLQLYPTLMSGEYQYYGTIPSADTDSA